MTLLVKDNMPGQITLAIGDGANDVSMIQARTPHPHPHHHHHTPCRIRVPHPPILPTTSSAAPSPPSLPRIEGGRAGPRG